MWIRVLGFPVEPVEIEKMSDSFFYGQTGQGVNWSTGLNPNHEMGSGQTAIPRLLKVSVVCRKRS
jgi:hypothetical protein